jgi:hypothetical protein
MQHATALSRAARFAGSAAHIMKPAGFASLISLASVAARIIVPMISAATDSNTSADEPTQSPT